MSNKKKPRPSTGVGPNITIRQCMTARGRDAKTGEFTTVEYAQTHPRTHSVERIPKPGFGGTSKRSKNR